MARCGFHVARCGSVVPSPTSDGGRQRLATIQSILEIMNPPAPGACSQEESTRAPSIIHPDVDLVRFDLLTLLLRTQNLHHRLHEIRYLGIAPYSARPSLEDAGWLLPPTATVPHCKDTAGPLQSHRAHSLFMKGQPSTNPTPMLISYSPTRMRASSHFPLRLIRYPQRPKKRYQRPTTPWTRSKPCHGALEQKHWPRPDPL